jgi:Protein of unknown function (DUF2853)
MRPVCARVELIRSTANKEKVMIRTDYEKNVSKYVKSVDKGKLAAIIRACGIALRGRDAQYVSMSDPAEVERVAKGFGTKKLGLSESATKAALAKVAKTMHGENAKMRTTVYYLLAVETGTLGKLVAPAPAKKAAKKAVKKVKKAAKKAVKKTAKKAVKKKAAKKKVAKKTRKK